MKKAYIILFGIIIGISLIVSSIIYVGVEKYKDKRQETIKKEKEITDKIIANYYEQEKRIEVINEKLGYIKDNLDQFTQTYVDMYKVHKDFFVKLEEIEKLIADSYDKTKYLDEKCKTVYSNLDANAKCQDYYIYLENITNGYIYLYKYISTKVKEYNEWFSTYKGEYKVNKITIYETKYKSYVDLNNDKTLLGVVEE